ncbi:MAG0920 family protein [Mycoplasmopsis arginini]|uniref:MAG0920 family protein n=1 Tax=Mycoplasmopsis arginini TaxID=2094 RepID=UPI00163B672B
MNIITFKTLLIIFFVFALILFTSFFTLLLLFFAPILKRILLKKDAKKIFLSKKIRINEHFFKTINQKIKISFIFLSIFLAISILTILSIFYPWLDVLINLPQSKAKINLFVLFPFFTMALSLFIFIFSLTLIIQLCIIKREFKNWEIENNKLNGVLFENIENIESKEIFNTFKFSNDLNMTYITNVWPSFSKQYKIKNKNWKNRFYKYNETKRDEEFYYFLIFNYEDVAIDNTIFKIEDYSYIYQNRDQIFSYNKKTGE